jgi:hypothetical protein
MTMLKTLATACAFVVCLGGAAFASDASEVGNPGMLLYSNGMVISVAPGSKMHKMIMEHATLYNGMIYASAGRVYTIKNAKMPNGKMLFDLLSPGNPNYEPDFNR